MGCDIHFYVEAWDDNAKRWVSQDTVSKAEGEFQLYEQFGDYCFRGRGDIPTHWYMQRNYLLFSVLANVRNDEGNPIPFITDQRGMPDDLSPEMQELYDPDCTDLHSHTWMTLKEVLDWPHWNKPLGQKIAKYEGGKIVDEKQRKTIREWCSSFWDVSIRKMKKLRKDPADVRLLMWFDN